jgi:hypothetical protein
VGGDSGKSLLSDRGKVNRSAALVTAAAVLLVACGDDNKAKNRSSAAVAQGVKAGKGLTYEIRGPVSKVTDCGTGPNPPKLGARQRATSSLKLSGSKFTASIGAASDLPSRYASYTGVLREDGSFRLRSDYSSPGDIYRARLEGRFTNDGEIRGSWTLGLPGTLPNNLDDPNCRIRVSPLSSSFYFGVKRVDWHQAFGVR